MKDEFMKHVIIALVAGGICLGLVLLGRQLGIREATDKTAFVDSVHGHFDVECRVVDCPECPLVKFRAQE